MKKQKLKVAFLSTGSPNYFSIEYGVHDTQLDGLHALETQAEFTLLDVGREVQTCEQLAQVADVLKSADLLLVLCGSFSDGNIAEQLAALKKPVALWSVEEPCSDGDIKLHSLITQSLFASIFNKYLNHSVCYFTLFGASDSDAFATKFCDIVFALKAKKRVSGCKIGQIGREADGFLNLREDEEHLADTFGLTICKHDVSEVVALATACTPREVADEMQRLKESGATITVSELKLQKTCSVYLALRQLCRRHGYDAVAVGCWPEFQELYDLVPCLAFSMLLEYDDICISCEGDIGGALSMLIAQELSGQLPSLMDFTQICNSKNAVQLWHCGFSPMSYAGGQNCLIDHPMLNRKLEKERHMGVAQNFVIDADEVTFLRITGRKHKLFAVTGKKNTQISDGFTGVRIWLDSLQAFSGGVGASQLTELILSNGIEHHYAICRKNILERARIYSSLSNLELLG